MTRRQFSRWLAGMAAGVACARHGFAQTPTPPSLLVAVSEATLAGANVNDARAAYRVWIQQVTASLGITSIRPIPEIFVPSEQILQLIRHGDIDVFGITAWEYAKVIEFTDPNSLLVEDYLENGMQYVLLVHEASPFKKIDDLRGSHLTMLTHREMNLMPAWIGNLLAARNLPRMDLFFAEQAARNSVTQVVLPVFFRRMDAACLSRRHFETAVELNPQLGRDLRVLAISPTVVPIALCFHKHCTEAAEQLLKSALVKTASLLAGQQLAALYQSRTFVPRPASVMQSTLEMLREYAQVLTRTPQLRKEHS
jgi:phosphonate transport system substrate-binding protein